jgi:hypothetical protein
MESLIELLQYEKLSTKTKRFLCAIHSLPIIEGSSEFGASYFAEHLGVSMSEIISCCVELQDNNISYIEPLEDGEYFYFRVSIGNKEFEVSIKLFD